jgi:hypothetical protein
MATSTIVITYTAASGDASTKVTSATVGGTAYASLTQTDVKLAASLCSQLAALLRSPAQEAAAGAAGVVQGVAAGGGGSS